MLCSGNTPETRGTAYVVYEDIFDAKNACDHLSGFNVCNRYLVVLYYNANRVRAPGLGKSPLNRAVTKKQPQHQFVNAVAWVFLRNKIQTVRGSEWDAWSVSHLLGDLCAKKVPLDKGCEKHVCEGCSLEKRVQKLHNCTAAAGGEILFMGKKSPVLDVILVTDGIQGPVTFSRARIKQRCVCMMVMEFTVMFVIRGNNFL